MTTPVKSILRRHTENKYNILCLAYDGFFERNLALTGHNIYCPLKSGHILPGKFSDNVYIIDKEISDMPISTHYDMVIVNDKLNQYEAGRKIANFYQIPLIMVEHYYCLNNVRPQDLLGLAGQKFDARFADYPGMVNSWGLEECLVVPTGVHRRNKIGDRKQVLVYGNFSASDYNILMHLLEKIPNIKLCGNNPNLPSTPVTQEELEAEIDKSLVYLNLSISSNVPYTLLDALGNDCLVVSNITRGTNELLGKNNIGMLVEDINNFSQAINHAISNRAKMLEAQKLYIEKHHSMETFTKSWAGIFAGIKGYIYAS